MTMHNYVAPDFTAVDKLAVKNKLTAEGKLELRWVIKVCHPTVKSL